ncbi:methyl-accepting chemotaxis protein [Photobacterium swingsii]|uniref:methyl-accepting chemotaxis protein n=2 Tax=Photobacterium swingsii TaxID=680026 RepID=UPI00352FD992
MRALSVHSIRGKLLSLALLLVSGIIAFGFIEKMAFDNLSTLQSTAQETTRSQNDLLTLRRYEKDFLSRLDPKYIVQFNQTYQTLVTRLQQIESNLHYYELANQADFLEIFTLLNQYATQFNLITDQRILIGLTPDQGLQGQIHQAADAAEEAILLTADDRLRRMLLTLRRNEKDFLLTSNIDHVTAFDNNADTLLTAISASHLASSDKHPLKRSILMYKTMFDELSAGYQTIGLTPAEGLYGQLRTAVHNVESDLKDLEKTTLKSISARVQTEEIILAVIGLGFTLLISGALLIISRQISQRLAKVNAIMASIAAGEGDLTVRMDDKGKDELSQLSQSFDQFTARLQAIIRDVALIAQQLSSTTKDSHQASTHSMTNAEQQQAESASVATAVNELLATSNDIAANIGDAAHAVEDVQNEALASQKISQQAGNSLQCLAADITASQTLITQLELQSQSINKVISVIRDITDQTNLLALNAAIEAARAGDQGRGFAVVADEVRQLAQNTHHSTKEIEQTVEDLHNGVEEIVAIMHKSQEQTTVTVEQTQSAVLAMNRIGDAIGGILDKNLQIASASEQQAMVSAEIDKNITHISELAQHTVSMIQQSAESSHEVSAMAEQLDKVVNQFKY